MITQIYDHEMLADLARTNLDVETAFTVCAHSTRDERLRAMLQARALLCGNAARSLMAALSSHAYQFRDGVTRRRGAPDWMVLHAAMLAHDDASLREECVRTEEETLMRFRDLLDHDLPVDIQSVVRRYFSALLHQYGCLRELDLPKEDGPANARHASPDWARIARHAYLLPDANGRI